MVKNYLKIALRNLSKRKGFTFINILGLAIGIACCLLIAVYVSHELSYDQFHEKSDRIYRVTQKTVTTAKEENGASTPFPVGPTLKSDYSGQIAQSVRFFDMQEKTRTILYEGGADVKAFLVDNFYFVDSTFFDVFSANLIRGNPQKALSEPLSIVITEGQARRFFGDKNPMGKTLDFKGVEEFTVTGVMKPLPTTSHFQVDMLASFNSLPILYNGSEVLNRWYWNPCWTYVLLEEGISPEELEQQFPDFVDKNYANREEGETLSLSLQPLTDIHLHSNLDSEIRPNGSIFYVWLFSAVALLILVIACINFMNLSTARATERAREVGMRKVLGADRRQLVGQFMGESFLMTLLGFALALGLAYLTMPWFSDFVGKSLNFSFFGTPQMIVGLVALFVLVAILSGLYPALYLSRFSPMTIMHGSKGTTSGGNGEVFRKGLVVFQFALSVILIISTIVIYLQLQHMQNKELGFDQERIAVMPIKQNLIAWEFEQFREKALASPNILQVAGTGKILGSEKQHFSKYSPANLPAAPPTNMKLDVTYGFLDTYKIPLIAGRGFSRDHATDAEQAILINRSMLQQLEVSTPQEALGKTFYYTNSDDERNPLQVIGVVEDFNYTSIKKEVSPLVINMEDETRRVVGSIDYVAVRFAPNGVQAGLDDIEKIWKEINHITPFTYSFLDEELQKIYASETKMSNVAGLFSILCIFVACLGLFGLASFTASKRTKEIGIRKTLGATVPNIVGLLSRDYLKLIVVANIIAWPVIYYLSVQWLQDFPHRIPLGWNLAGVFLVAGIGTLLICLLTVSYQSVRAALINPVESIQQE